MNNPFYPNINPYYLYRDGRIPTYYYNRHEQRFVPFFPLIPLLTGLAGGFALGALAFRPPYYPYYPPYGPYQPYGGYPGPYPNAYLPGNPAVNPKFGGYPY